MTIKPNIDYSDFEKIDMRVGKVIKIEDFPDAKLPAYKLWIDFGKDLGVKTSSARLVKNQTKEELLGKQLICVVNFKPKKVGVFTSEVLVLGTSDGTDGITDCIILTTLKEAPIGGHIY